MQTNPSPNENTDKQKPNPIIDANFPIKDGRRVQFAAKQEPVNLRVCCRMRFCNEISKIRADWHK